MPRTSLYFEPRLPADPWSQPRRHQHPSPHGAHSPGRPRVCPSSVNPRFAVRPRPAIDPPWRSRDPGRGRGGRLTDGAPTLGDPDDVCDRRPVDPTRAPAKTGASRRVLRGAEDTVQVFFESEFDMAYGDREELFPPSQEESIARVDYVDEMDGDHPLIFHRVVAKRPVQQVPGPRRTEGGVGGRRRRLPGTGRAGRRRSSLVPDPGVRRQNIRRRDVLLGGPICGIFNRPRQGGVCMSLELPQPRSNFRTPCRAAQ